jgi:hypothetical protein
MSLPTLLFILFSSMTQPWLEAQEDSGIRGGISTFKDLLDRTPSRDLAAIVRDISRANAVASSIREARTGAADVIEGFAAWPRSIPVDDTREPRIAFVAESDGTAGSYWPLAALLAAMDSVAGDPPETGAYFFIVECSAGKEPGDGTTLPDNRRIIRDYLADSGMDAVVLLDINGPPIDVAVKFSSLGFQSPLHLVKAAKKAAALSMHGHGDDAVGQLLAAAGLDAGSKMLGPWLASGIPALVLESRANADEGVGGAAWEMDIADFASRLTSMVPDGFRHGFDRGYLRYPLPAGSITIDDTTIVIMFIATSVMLGVAVSMGLLSSRNRAISPIGLVREVLTALVLSFLSFWVVGAAVKLAMGAVSGSLLDGLMQAGKVFHGWIASFSLALRGGAFLSAYYAFSGLASRFGMLGQHGRFEVALAASILLCIEAMVAMALFPPVVPFFLSAILLAVFTARSGVASGLGLVAEVLVLLPYIIRVLFATSGNTDAAVIMLEADTGGILVMACIAAPFILWTVVASSSAASLHRGRRTAAAWAVSAMLFSLGEAAVRTAMQFR